MPDTFCAHITCISFHWKKKKKKIWKFPPPEFCPWVQSDVGGNCISRNATAQIQTTCNILGPILPFFLSFFFFFFPSGIFIIRKFSSSLLIILTPVLMHPGKVSCNTLNYKEIKISLGKNHKQQIIFLCWA